MKHLYSCNILNHPYIKNEDDVKKLINILNTSDSYEVDEGESYIIRRTLSGSWVWDKMTRNIIDIGGRLYENIWVEKFNNEKLNTDFYGVGRNPNKGFLMINNTLWGIVTFDINIKGRNMKRLNIPNQILNEISDKIGFTKRKKHTPTNPIYYVDKDDFKTNLSNIQNSFDKLVVNLNDEFKIPIYISKYKNENHQIIMEEN
jgi:hypothetical protein